MADSSKQIAAETPFTPMSVIAPAMGWLVPGAGHIIQGRWGRGILLMASIVTMYMLGIAMKGHVYSPNGGDLLDMLSFLGDLCAGGLYIISRALDWNPGAVSQATADYGSKFIVVSGLLNFICVADAYHIAIGKKR